MKRLILISLLCSLQSYAAAEDQSQASSLAMNWAHVKNCILDVLPDEDLHGKVRPGDMLQCETADRDFFNLVTENYSAAKAEEMGVNVLFAAANRVYILKSGQYVLFKQLDMEGKIDVLEFCRETCQDLNN